MFDMIDVIDVIDVIDMIDMICMIWYDTIRYDIFVNCNWVAYSI